MNPASLTVEEFSTPGPVSVSATERLPNIWDLMQAKGIRPPQGYLYINKELHIEN